MVFRARRFAGCGRVAFAGVIATVAVAHADSGFEERPLRPMAGAMLSTELQLDPSGELWIGIGRLGDWAASLQVPLYYRSDDDFFGYGVHGAYRLWPQVLGGAVFLEPNVGFTSGLTNGVREAGIGGGLSFGYTFHQGNHAWVAVKAGFDIAPVSARGFVGLELLLH